MLGNGIDVISNSQCACIIDRHPAAVRSIVAMRISAAYLLVPCVILVRIDASFAQVPSGDPAVGRQLAEQWCSGCHATVPTQPHKSSDVAPSFSAIARTPSTTSMSLHAFLQTPHGQMPDLTLSRDEIDDLVAYILSLRGR
jgi:mono/diheme cytochrome c family protein